MKQVVKILVVSSLLLIGIIINSVAQITGTLENVQTPIQEVRKASTIEYSVASLHNAGDEYSWEIIGGMPSVAPSSGSGTAADPYIINFAAGLHTINVQWAAEDNTITSFNGRVRVQKRSAAGCITVIQTQQVDCWSAATVTMTSPATQEICNGENVGLAVTVAFTGAPVFDLDYTIEETLTGVTNTTNQTLTGITGNTATITIPDHLLNATNADQTYRITITRMNDAFVGNGTIGASNTFTLTVHPAAETGPITVSPASLQRR